MRVVTVRHVAPTTGASTPCNPCTHNGRQVLVRSASPAFAPPMPTLHCGFDPEAAADFAALLGRPGAPLNLRAFPPTSAPADVKKRIGPRKPPWDDTATIEQAQAEGRGIYAVINPGGDTKASITHAVAHFAESDEGTKDEQWARVAASPLPPPSFVIDGGGRSLHFYWVFFNWITDLAAWQRNQKRIAKLLDFDPSVQDPSRVMRLPGAWYIGTDLQPTCRTTIVHRSGALYSFEQIDALLPPDVSEPLLQPVAVPPVVPMPPPPAGDDDDARRTRAALDQLQRIPPRIPGSNTRPDYLRLLWGLAAILGPDDAGRVMASHSPAWAAEEDLTDKAAEADGSINAGTFFEVARSVWGVTGPRRRRPAGSASTPPPAGVMEAISAEAYRLHCLPPNDPTRTPGTTDLIRRFVDAVHDSPGADAQISDFLDGLAGLITRAPAKKIVKERREEIRNDRRQQQKQERLEEVRQQAAARPDPILQLISSLPTPPDGKVDAGALHAALTPIAPIYSLRFNLMFRAIEMGGAEIPEHSVELAHVKFQAAGWKVTAADTYSALIATAREDSYHPVMEYLDRVEHDNTTPYVDLDAIASTYFGTTTSLYDQMMKVALIGAVRRIRQPGCQHDTVLVLQGTQGCGKTNFWKTLAGEQWYTPCSTGKEVDMLMLMHRAWIVEMAELEGITSRHDISALRTLVTTTTDGFRPPYGRTTTMNPRRFALVATVNPAGFLNDPEGFRRWHCIQLPHAEGQFIDIDRVARDRDAIWKAAALAQRAGAVSHLPPELQALSNATNQVEHVSETAWDAPIAAWASSQMVGTPFSVADVLVQSGVRDKTHIQPQDYGRVAQILKTLGWARHPVKSRKAWMRQK
jgi:hypothetical protein